MYIAPWNLNRCYPLGERKELIDGRCQSDIVKEFAENGLSKEDRPSRATQRFLVQLRRGWPSRSRGQTALRQEQTRLLESFPNRCHTMGPIIFIAVPAGKHLRKELRSGAWNKIMDNDKRVHRRRIVTLGSSEREGFRSCR